MLIVETQDRYLERAGNERDERLKVHDEKVGGKIAQLPPDGVPIRNIIRQHAGILDDRP